jgi:hypothetical protein
MDAAGRMGMPLFTTDGLGPGYGFEVMNTGAVRNHSPFEQASKVTLGNADNLELAQAATGVTFFGFAPGSDLSHYIRAVYMPQIRGWDVGVGAGIHGGSTKATVADGNLATRCAVAVDEVCTINTRAWFVDAQAQGALSGHELGVYFMFAQGDDPGTKAGEVNLFGGSAGMQNRRAGASMPSTA